jgi:antitoxin (DNA-binding transcriptional repressor) of toxin-antitoxin stability system
VSSDRGTGDQLAPPRASRATDEIAELVNRLQRLLREISEEHEPDPAVLAILEAARIGVGDLPVGLLRDNLALVLVAIAGGARLRLLDSNGQPVAAIVPAEILADLEAAEDAADLAAAEASDAADGELIPLRAAVTRR